MTAMTPKYLKSSRSERAAAQYASARSADEYASAYQDSRAVGRFLRARLQLVQDVLTSCPGGDLLDAGCGPGVMVQALLESRPHDFRISVLDRSRAMVRHCAASAQSLGKVYAAVGQLEALPYADATFDVTLTMGVLEYTNARAAVNEISRVTRPDGLVVVTMLNPLSLYQITQWVIYRPAFRVLGMLEMCLRIPAERRHKISATGIRALTPGKLRRLMERADLKPVDLVYYDLALPVPSSGRPSSMTDGPGPADRERRATARWSRWLGTGYLVVAKRGQQHRRPA
jgi:ubiquinone/menaquinone biosynthesis C-methylase UbiE